MRRHDKEMAPRSEIDGVIHAARVCRIAMARNDEPYLVPVSFGYDGEAIYFHTAGAGRKLEFIEANPGVCFEFETNVRLISHPTDPCAWTFSFESVIGYGKVCELTAPEDKARGLKTIMRHYSGRDWDITEQAAATTRVWRIEIESVTGKRSIEKPTE